MNFDDLSFKIFLFLRFRWNCDICKRFEELGIFVKLVLGLYF